MPELPEVETIRRRLAEILPGQKITALNQFHPKSFQGASSQILNTTIKDVSRRAKLLQFELDNELWLVTHLKMTGQLIYVDDQRRVGGGHPTNDWTQQLPSNHTRIEYQFDNGGKLFFNDQRIFGWMRVMTSQQLQAEHAKHGPDINDSDLTAQYLFDQLQRRTIPIKQAIMTNQIVAGVGNIYACDALNQAKISPFRPANTLSASEVERLFVASQDVIQRGIELQGTTFDGKYVTVDGMAGRYQEEVWVYDQEGQPCRNCAAPILKQKIAGRGTYFCGVCQQ